MNEQDLVAELSHELESFEQQLKRPLTHDESDAVVGELLHQAARGEELNVNAAYWEAHPDGDRYDLDDTGDRRAYMSQRAQDLHAEEQEQEPDDGEPTPQLPLDATDSERREWMNLQMAGDSEKVERLIDVINERSAPDVAEG